MNLENLSWVGVKEYLKKRQDILLPFGSVEEHGYHLPLSTDGDIVQAICEGISKKTGILVAPLVWYGVSNTTKSYTGTTMVEPDTLKAYTKDILKALKNSGFTPVHITSGHYSNAHIDAIKEGAGGSDIDTRFLDFSKIDFSSILETKPFHACEAETSLMMHLHPEKVDMEKAVDEDVEIVDDQLVPTKSGVFGYPTKATAKKGKLLFDAIVKELADAIEQEKGQ
ncbi:MAG: creatininase family protein [Candidatus Hydrothermarchaeaceae archaeon]